MWNAIYIATGILLARMTLQLYIEWYIILDYDIHEGCQYSIIVLLFRYVNIKKKL